MSECINGIIPAAVVAYDDDGNISTDRLEYYYRYLFDNGVNGVFVGGSTGEWPLLTMDERKKAAEIAVSVASGCVPVIMHISSLLIDEVVSYSIWAEKAGVSALSLIMPFYYSYNEEGLYEYFSQILRHIHLPVLIYNIPGNVKNILTPGFLKRLAVSFPVIRGVKDSSMDFLQLQDYMEEVDIPGFLFFTGNDAQIVPAMKWGASGAVSAAACAFPKFVTRMAHSVDDDFCKAKEMQESIMRYRRFVVSHTPLSVVKAALELNGIKVGKPRSPLCGLNDVELNKLQSIIDMEGFLNG